METSEIIKILWTLPWYKVAWIGIVNQLIFFTKTWFVWLVLILIAIFYEFVKGRTKKRRIK